MGEERAERKSGNATAAFGFRTKDVARSRGCDRGCVVGAVRGADGTERWVCVPRVCLRCRIV